MKEVIAVTVLVEIVHDGKNRADAVREAMHNCRWATPHEQVMNRRNAKATAELIERVTVGDLRNATSKVAAAATGVCGTTIRNVRRSWAASHGVMP